VKPLTILRSKGRLLALDANVRLEWKKLTVANTLAYYYKESITTVKFFTVMHVPMLCSHYIFLQKIGSEGPDKTPIFDLPNSFDLNYAVP
jgi:hypothetical protein